MSWGILILLATALALVVALALAGLVRALTRPARRTVGELVAHGLPTTPAEAGYEHTPHRLTLPDGAPLEVWDVEGRAPDGPIVVMLHGWGDARLGELQWLEMLGPLAARIVIFDQRAHGDSAHRRCTWGDREAGDALAVIEQLRGGWPDRPVVLLGYSMGAAAALRAAREAPHRVDAVIAESPYRRMRDVVRRTMRRNRLPGALLAGPAVRLMAWRWPALRADDLCRVAAEVRQPLLVLCGERDEVAPPEDARAIAEVAPDGRFHPFSDAGHLEAPCAHGTAYRKLLAGFLDGVRSATASPGA